MTPLGSDQKCHCKQGCLLCHCIQTLLVYEDPIGESQNCHCYQTVAYCNRCHCKRGVLYPATVEDLISLSLLQLYSRQSKSQLPNRRFESPAELVMVRQLQQQRVQLLLIRERDGRLRRHRRQAQFRTTDSKWTNFLAIQFYCSDYRIVIENSVYDVTTDIFSKFKKNTLMPFWLKSEKGDSWHSCIKTLDRHSVIDPHTFPDLQATLLPRCNTLETVYKGKSQLQYFKAPVE